MTNLDKFKEVFGFYPESFSWGDGDEHFPWIIPCGLNKCSNCPLNVLGVDDDEENKSEFQCADAWWFSEYKGE